MQFPSLSVTTDSKIERAISLGFGTSGVPSRSEDGGHDGPCSNCAYRTAQQHLSVQDEVDKPENEHQDAEGPQALENQIHFAVVVFEVVHRCEV